MEEFDNENIFGMQCVLSLNGTDWKEFLPVVVKRTSDSEERSKHKSSAG